MKSVKRMCAPICALFLASGILLFAQGPLTPPGAPAPTMKSLDQVEPRTIINAANTPGNASCQFIISAPGSYYLTGNITGVSGKSGIFINSSNVTIDLNGFALIGVSGSGSAITDGGTFHINTAVRNGNIDSWGGDGINLSTTYGSLVENLFVSNSAGVGVRMYDSCVMRNCVVHFSTSDNIVAGYDANLSYCTSIGSSGGYGIIANYSSTITHCASNTNKLIGISTGSTAALSHCSAASNLGGGISVGTGSTVTGCSANGNGDSSGTTVGIFTANDCTVTDCNASYNFVQYGIVANPGSTVAHCTASNNSSAQTISAGILGAGSTVIGCTTGSNTTTNATLSHTTGMGIYVNGSNATIKNCACDGNKGDGINVITNCVVTENECNNNGVDGIFSGPGGVSRIDGNHTNFNGGVGIHSSFDWVVRNTSGSNSGGNYVPASGADIAPIQTASTATNPYANLQ